MKKNCDDNSRDLCDAEFTECGCAGKKTTQSFGGSCPFCELFIEVLRNNEVAKKDLAMLSLHLDKEPYHLCADA
jgi:hypothetical protein